MVIQHLPDYYFPNYVLQFGNLRAEQAYKIKGDCTLLA